ncbi:FbpB family small basic protein [Cytobacillus sp. FJAT-53684]|uniref:FbpB family small basic protein n=1 Tax=Cytobacillus mangrovibacter TaxID=3299024 RepID=A0ABW6JZ82_9BACI
MTRKRVTLSNLIRKNKEELLKDQDQLEKIEKRIDDKYLKRKKEAKAI